MTGIVAHTYPEWWLKLTGQAAHWSTDYSAMMGKISIQRFIVFVKGPVIEKWKH